MDNEIRVTRAMVEDGLVTEEKVHQFITEASSLGLPAGSFPVLLQTELGNGLPLLRWRRQPDDSVIYTQQYGCVVLVVLND